VQKQKQANKTFQAPTMELILYYFFGFFAAGFAIFFAYKEHYSYAFLIVLVCLAIYSPYVKELTVGSLLNIEKYKRIKNAIKETPKINENSKKILSNKIGNIMKIHPLQKLHGKARLEKGKVYVSFQKPFSFIPNIDIVPLDKSILQSIKLEKINPSKFGFEVFAFKKDSNDIAEIDCFLTWEAYLIK